MRGEMMTSGFLNAEMALPAFVTEDNIAHINQVSTQAELHHYLAAQKKGTLVTRPIHSDPSRGFFLTVLQHVAGQITI